MRFFFGILDQAQVNARILYTCKYEAEKHLSAAAAIKQLVLHLLTPYLQEKLKNATVRAEIRKGIQLILDDKSAVPEGDRPQLEKRARCSLCPYAKDKKTNCQMQCPSCLRPMCDKHRVYLCNDCTGSE